MGNFWRGAAEVGNALYDYVGDKKRWELADTQNALQRMKMEALQEEVVGRKAEGEALKGVSMYDTKTTEMPEYQGVVSPPDPNEGYAAPPESALMRQTTIQTPRSTIDVHREVANKLRAAGQGKMALMYDNAARAEEQNVHTNLWNSLKFAVDKGDDNMANSILETAPESFLQATGMKRGEKFSGGGQEYEMTKMASPSNPISLPDGTVATEGNWLVKIDKRGRTVKADRKDRDDQAVASLREFEMATGIDQSLRGTPQYSSSYMSFLKNKGEQRPINIQFVPTNEGIVTGNPRTGQLGGSNTGFGKPMSNEMITALQQIGTLKDALDEVDILYTVDKKNKKYRDEWVGPAAGRLGAIAEQTIGVDPDRSRFMSLNAQMGNTLVYLMSGKQINETEYQRLKKQLPDVNLPPKNYRARLEEFKRTLNSIIDQRKKNMGGYIPKEVGGKQPVRPPLSSFEKE